MLTNAGHLTFCSNIFSGESWPDHFEALKRYFPAIKQELSPKNPMGIGLRLSNKASLELVQEDRLEAFSHWLTENEAYVFTMNGFPYGGFHQVRVKDQVHTPDWTTEDRVAYTIRLFNILERLLPSGMDGGVSTSPLSYRLWFKSPELLKEAREKATANVLRVAAELIRINKISGKCLHLDIEPEPDGIMETGAEFMDWFENELLPAGSSALSSKFELPVSAITQLLKTHIRLCYDVCHFAISYEQHEQVLALLKEKGIRVGKIQISAALKAGFGNAGERAAVREAFSVYNEPVYLHQVVARKENGELLHFPDLPEALAGYDHPDVKEWRAHFHVPVFLSQFGVLQSTRQDIREVLELQMADLFTQHLEVETYTWEVLPPALKLPLHESIIRELQWVTDILKTKNAKS